MKMLQIWNIPLVHVMSGGEQGDVRVWEIKTRQMVLHLKEHKMAVTALQICDADMCVLSSSRDCSILKWDLTRGERVAALRQRMGGINGIVLQGDGTRLLSVGQDKKVGFWDLRVAVAGISSSSSPESSSCV